MAISVHWIQSMSGYFAISLKRQQKSKYNLCKHQFRGNLKIKNSWISSKGLVGIEINLSQKNLLSFLDHKPFTELLKTFSSIWYTGKFSVYGLDLSPKIGKVENKHFKNWRLWAGETNSLYVWFQSTQAQFEFPIHFRIQREMEPQQQFTEVNAQFSKFVPGTAQNIPSIAAKKLKTLKYQKVGQSRSDTPLVILFEKLAWIRLNS